MNLNKNLISNNLNLEIAKVKIPEVKTGFQKKESKPDKSLYNFYQGIIDKNHEGIASKDIKEKLNHPKYQVHPHIKGNQLFLVIHLYSYLNFLFRKSSEIK